MHPGGARRPSDPSGTDFSLGPAPSRDRVRGDPKLRHRRSSRSASDSHTSQIGEARRRLRSCRASICPSWARAVGGRRPTRTLLIQRYHRLNSSTLQLCTRVRVIRTWSLKALILDFAVLYSLRCRVWSYQSRHAAPTMGTKLTESTSSPGTSAGSSGTARSVLPRSICASRARRDTHYPRRYNPPHDPRR
jgi:hypothetical protein